MFICWCVLCSGAGLPGAVPSVSGEAAGGFCSAEEGSGSRFGETQSSQGGRQDAAHVRQGHAGRDGWGRLSVTDIYLLYIKRVQLETTHLGTWKCWKESYKNKHDAGFFLLFSPFSLTDLLFSPRRERRLPGVGSRWNKLPSASCPSGGGGAEDAEDGQSDLRHPTGDDAGNRRTGDTNWPNEKTLEEETKNKSMKCLNGSTNKQVKYMCGKHLKHYTLDKLHEAYSGTRACAWFKEVILYECSGSHFYLGDLLE